MKKVLVFTDCDFDDTASISLLLCQHLQKQIMILGIVCEDGFLEFPDNISWITKWLCLNGVTDIPIIKGFPSTSYLLSERKFPSNWVLNYKKMLVENYNVDFSQIPPYEDLEPFIEKVKLQPFVVNLLSPIRSYGILLRRYCNFRTKQSNFTGGGFISEEVPGVDSTWNNFLDPDGFRDYLMFSSCPSIVLNSTYQTLPFNHETLKLYEELGKKYVVNPLVSKDLKNIFTKTMTFLQNFLDSEVRDSDLSLWDVVTTMLLLKFPMDQRSRNFNILVSWTGGTQIESSKNQKCCGHEQIGNKTNSFTFLHSEKFNTQFVKRFFE